MIVAPIRRRLAAGEVSGLTVGSETRHLPRQAAAGARLRLEHWVAGGAVLALVVLIVLPLLSLLWGSVAAPGGPARLSRAALVHDARRQGRARAARRPGRAALAHP